MKLLLCSQNIHKIREYKHALEKTGYTLVTLKDLNDYFEVDEGGETFEENALIKAKYFANKYNMTSIADDSGLLVKALNNLPGVHSHRYANTNEERVNKVIFELKGKKDRSALFKSVIALYDPKDGSTHYFEGVLDIIISDKPKGSNGFGYDPILYIPPLSKTLAELTADEKLKISHRGKAIRKLTAYLNENINNF